MCAVGRTRPRVLSQAAAKVQTGKELEILVEERINHLLRTYCVLDILINAGNPVAKKDTVHRGPVRSVLQQPSSV